MGGGGGGGGGSEEVWKGAERKKLTREGGEPGETAIFGEWSQHQYGREKGRGRDFEEEDLLGT